MQRSVYCFVILSVVMVMAACDAGRKPAAAKTGIQERDGHVTISGMRYPLYPGATLFQDLKISVACMVKAEPSDVRAWYDKQMVAEGWRSMTDWADFGGQYQKTFLSGQALRNPQLAEKMVLLGVAKHKKGGTHLTIMPIANKYRSKKAP